MIPGLRFGNLKGEGRKGCNRGRRGRYDRYDRLAGWPDVTGVCGVPPPCVLCISSASASPAPLRLLRPRCICGSDRSISGATRAFSVRCAFSVPGDPLRLRGICGPDRSISGAPGPSAFAVLSVFRSASCPSATPAPCSQTTQASRVLTSSALLVFPAPPAPAVSRVLCVSASRCVSRASSSSVPRHLSAPPEPSCSSVPLTVLPLSTQYPRPRPHSHTKAKPRRTCVQRGFQCPGQESNLHALRHTHLKRARLPIPPPGHCYRCLPELRCAKVILFSQSATLSAVFFQKKSTG